MKKLWFLAPTQSFFIFEASLLRYVSLVSASYFTNSSTSSTRSSSSVSSTTLSSRSSSTTTSSDLDCGDTSCTININPITIAFPKPVSVVEQTVTATVIPIIKVWPNGSRVTERSTFLDFNGSTNVSFSQSLTEDLTWETFGTTLTYPTTYVAYADPSLTLVTSTDRRKGPTCAQETFDIPLPPTATSQLIFPSHGKATPGTQIAFDLIDSLPVVTRILGGDDPRDCQHAAPFPSFGPQVPFILPFESLTHTSVAVLTQVGQPVTVAINPLQDNQPPPNDPPPQNGGTPPPQGANQPNPSQEQTGGGSPGGAAPGAGLVGVILTALGFGSPSGTPAAPGTGAGPGTFGSWDSSPAAVDGVAISPGLAPSAVVINGQTLTAGQVATLPNGTPVSVGPGGSVVVVGGATVPVTGIVASATRSTSSSKSSSSASKTSPSVGAAIASGINNHSSEAVRRLDGKVVGIGVLFAAGLVPALW